MEIYNIHAYFSGATQATLEAANSTTADLAPEQRRSVEGDKRLRRIARAGKKWKQTIGRTLDMEGKLLSLVFGNLSQLFDPHQSMSTDYASNGPDSGQTIEMQ